MIITPPFLQPGDTIGVICPAGFMPFEKAATCINTLQQWGYNVKIGESLGNQFHYFAGTDAERLADIQMMIDDNNVKAILCARGGYGVSRIVDAIDFSEFKKNPKWIVGYSDITALHGHIYNMNIAGLHAPMAAAFNDDGYKNEFIQSLKKTLEGEPNFYACKSYKLNRAGEATGELVGGNLSLLTHIIGTASDIDTAGKILFIEDVGEYIYNVDRMMVQLQRTGKLHRIAGLVVGSFTEMKDTTIPFGASVYDVIEEKVRSYNYPVCYDFPVGHTDNNYALKVGCKYRLTVDDEGARLREA